MLFQKSGDGLGHDAGEGEGDPDIQLSTCQVLQFLQPLQAVVGGMERLFGKRQQFQTSLGQYHLMAVSLEQGLLQFVLQLQNLMRKRALTDEQFFGRS